MEKFVIQNGINRDLFNPDRTFQLTNDKSGEKLVQLADFISGCVGKIFCVSHASERAKDIYTLIHQRLSVNYFPYETAHKFYLGKSTNEYDRLIKEMNIEAVSKYTNNSGVQNQEHLRVLEYLYLQSQIDNQRLVPTTEILTYVQNFYPNYTTEKLRLLVRDLRYDGMFIISHSGKPGYKLASSYQDIYKHFNHFLKYVIPMLKKVQIMNVNLSQISNNRVNPIEKDINLEQLKELIGAL